MLMIAREIRNVNGECSYRSIDMSEQVLAERQANGRTGIYHIVNNFGRNIDVELVYSDESPREEVLPEFDL